MPPANRVLPRYAAEPPQDSEPYMRKRGQPAPGAGQITPSLPPTPHAPVRMSDEAAFATASATIAQERAEWEKMRSLAKRVLAGDAQAYREAFTELSAFGELSAQYASTSAGVGGRPVRSNVARRIRVRLPAGRAG